MSGADDAAQRAEAERWYASADEDMRATQLLIAANPPALKSAAFHCQQSAEKLMKGLLIAHAIPFRRTHDLDELANALNSVTPELTGDIAELRKLTSWDVVFRYPDYEEPPLPKADQIAQALLLLAAFKQRIAGARIRPPAGP